MSYTCPTKQPLLTEEKYCYNFLNHQQYEIYIFTGKDIIKYAKTDVNFYVRKILFIYIDHLLGHSPGYRGGNTKFLRKLYSKYINCTSATRALVLVAAACALLYRQHAAHSNTNNIHIDIYKDLQKLNKYFAVLFLKLKLTDIQNCSRSPIDRRNTQRNISNYISLYDIRNVNSPRMRNLSSDAFDVLYDGKTSGFHRCWCRAPFRCL